MRKLAFCFISVGMLIPGLSQAITAVDIQKDGTYLMTVVYSIYESSCTGHADLNCDATGVVGKTCNGTSTCSIIVQNDICGDPDPTCAKHLYTTYKCSDGVNSYGKSISTPQDNIQTLWCDAQHWQ